MQDTEFSLQDGMWTAMASMPSWRGFQSRLGPYGAKNKEAPSTGMVTLVYSPDGPPIETLKAEDRALIDWVLTHEKDLADAALTSIVNAYPDIRADYEQSYPETLSLMPDRVDRASLKHLIGLHHVHIHPLRHGPAPYVGLEFGCDWEDEHGLGILMHGTRFVQIGWADTAFLQWIAERDAAGKNA